MPPLPGNTVLFVVAHSWNDESWSRKQDFCIPPDPEELDKAEEEEEKEDEEEEKKEEGEKEEDGRKKRGRKEEEHDPLTPTVSDFWFCSNLIWDGNF